MPFACSICEAESTRICCSCTKDTCSNHLCERCGCCSDCCSCEVRLDEPQTVQEAGFERHTNPNEIVEQSADPAAPPPAEET